MKSGRPWFGTRRLLGRLMASYVGTSCHARINEQRCCVSDCYYGSFWSILGSDSDFEHYRQKTWTTPWWLWSPSSTSRFDTPLYFWKLLEALAWLRAAASASWLALRQNSARPFYRRIRWRGERRSSGVPEES